MLLRSIALGAMFLVPLAAQAEVKGSMQVMLVTQKDGKEQFAPSDRTKPGDVLEYRIRYENTEEKPISQLAVTGPVPDGTEFVGGSANTAVASSLVYSIDGGRSFVALPTRANAAGQAEAVPPREYNALRWSSNEALLRSKPQEFRYRVRVKTGTNP